MPNNSTILVFQLNHFNENKTYICNHFQFLCISENFQSRGFSTRPRFSKTASETYKTELLF